MSFIAFPHPSDSSSHIVFDNRELLYATPSFVNQTLKHSINLTFKGRERPAVVEYNDEAERDQAYKALLHIIGA